MGGTVARQFEERCERVADGEGATVRELHHDYKAWGQPLGFADWLFAAVWGGHLPMGLGPDTTTGWRLHDDD